MDVKHCRSSRGRMVDTWSKNYQVCQIHELVDLHKNYIAPKKSPDLKIKILELNYEGKCRFEAEKLCRNVRSSKIQQVTTGDLIISRYNSFNGAIGYVLQDHDKHYVTDSYLVLKPKNKKTALYIWSILRSVELRAELLSAASGTGRQTVKWAGDRGIKNIQVPMLAEVEQKKIHKQVICAWKQEEKAALQINLVRQKLNDSFAVYSEESKTRFEETKPPR